MNIVIGGSYHKFLKEINYYHELFLKNGHTVLAPKRNAQNSKVDSKYNYILFQGEENDDPIEVQKRFTNSIKGADTFVICNPHGYIGRTAAMELGFAYANIKDPQSPLEQIYLTHNMPLISQLRHNFNLSPEQAKNDPGYQYLVHYFSETNIEDYLDFLQRTIMFFEYDGALTIGVDKLLTKTRTLDENDQER